MNSYYQNTPPPNYYNLPPPPPPNYPQNYNYNYNNYPPGPPAPPQNHFYAPPPPNHYTTNTANYTHTFNQQQHQQHRPPTNFTITTSPQDTSITLLTPYSDSSSSPPPQYSAQISKTSKPHIKLHRGPYPASQPLGTATMHTFSSTTDCILGPSSFGVKYSSLSGSFTLEQPLLGADRGSCKWKGSQLTGTNLELVDASGRKIAKVRITGGLSGLGGGSKKGKGKMLETYVPLSMEALDVVVLSGLVAIVGTRGMIEAGAEVFGAVAGV